MGFRARKLTNLARSTIWILGFQLASAAFSLTSAAGPYKPSRELIELSNLLADFQTRLNARTGIKGLLIGGGSSRAVLDHIYFNKKLEMRDLDIFVVADRAVTDEYCKEIGLALEGPALGRFSIEDLRPRPRYNPNLPFPHEFRAGWGFFWIAEDGRIFDLSVFDSEKTLKYNGVFSIDRIMLPLDGEQTLEKLAKKVAAVQPAQLSRSGLIRDLADGYTHWLSGHAELLGPESFMRDPALATLRSIRTFNKLRIKNLPPSFLAFVREAMKKAGPTHRLQMGRNFLKMLEDKEAAEELKTLAQAEVLSAWSTELEVLLKTIREKELVRILKLPRIPYQPRGPPEAMGKYLQLLDSLSTYERLKLLMDIATVEAPAVTYEVSKEIRKISPSLADVWSEGSFSEACFQSQECRDRIARALSSETLSSGERERLVVRALLGFRKPSDRETVFQNLAGRRLGDYNDFQKIWMVARNGYYTGVYNPMHLGHLEAAEQAVRDMALDQLVLMPTPATGHNETPLPWETRMEIAQLAVKNRSGLVVIDKSYESALRESTGKAIAKLVGSDPNAKWFHVMGSDSLTRYLERFGGTRDPNITVYAIARGQSVEVLKTLVAGHPGVVIGKGVAKASIGGQESERSSSVIRKRLQAGQSISGLVSAPVEDYILKMKLFQAPKVQQGLCPDLLTESPLY
ncbi:MAG: hypothetical protein JNL01_03535 [Bdellovibrionales bacterium]|nr:hypothetical protein [Bdellovibrionales bacterium]